jgi:MoxR-like ATPase
MLKQTSDEIIANVERVIVGKREVIELALVAILCHGHVLVEDVPGTGKTTLAKCLARSLGCTFRRIQFTPDLLPGDVTGISFFNQKEQLFEFRAGPVFAQVLLADEINRATPRTQSALLEAMQERQVTVDGQTMALPRPFLVLATQNPIELEGTFPLPEAQVDRFLLRLRIGYPTEEQENEILIRFESHDPLDDLEPVTTAEAVLEMQRQVPAIHVSEAVRRYILAICRASRQHPSVELGASPRGSLALYRACQALAAVRGREFVLPDDAKALAPAVLTHRLITSPQARLRGRDKEQIVQEIVASIPAPVEP